MPHDADVIHVRQAMERVIRICVEAFPGLQMLQEEPTPGIVFSPNPPINEIHVQRCQNETSAGQMATQVLVTGIGKVLHVVVPVGHENDRVATRAVRVPDPGVEREGIRLESPVVIPAFCTTPQAHHLRGIDRIRGEGYGVPVFSPVFVLPTPVEERLHG